MSNENMNLDTEQTIRGYMKRFVAFEMRAIASFCGAKSPQGMNEKQILEYIIKFASTESGKDKLRDVIRLVRDRQFSLPGLEVKDQKTKDITVLNNAHDIIRQCAAEAAEAHITSTMKAVDDVVKGLQVKADKDLSTIAAKLTKDAMAIAEKSRPLEIVINGKKTGAKITAVMPGYFEKLVKLAASRVNILLVGPAGCGKTYIAEQVAKALKLRFASISCSIGMSESQLSGWLLPIGAGGKFEHVMAQFIDLYENGGVFLLDEMDNADSNTLTFLNKALANDHFFVPQRFKKPKVERHPDFVCIAAANTFGHGGDSMYIREQLDGATLDRFRAGILRVTYDDRVEQALVDAEVLAWGQKMRQYIASHSLPRVVSTRLLLNFSKLKADHKFGADYWNEAFLTDWEESERLSALRFMNGEV